jgi:D-sedoheptulose 7-phosphate isomerase
MDVRQEGRDLTQALERFLDGRARVLARVEAALIEVLKKGGKLLAFGNGGSAAQSQHFAAELVNKFHRLGRALPALALTTDTSTLTSIANDLAFERVFSRQVEALGRPGDAVLGLSTSGKSRNVIEGFKAARAGGLTTVALTGQGGGPLAALADHLLDVDSASTPRVQEVHLFILHRLAGEIEAAFQ